MFPCYCLRNFTLICRGICLFCFPQMGQVLRILLFTTSSFLFSTEYNHENHKGTYQTFIPWQTKGKLICHYSADHRFHPNIMFNATWSYHYLLSSCDLNYPFHQGTKACSFFWHISNFYTMETNEIISGFTFKTLSWFVSGFWNTLLLNKINSPQPLDWCENVLVLETRHSLYNEWKVEDAHQHL